MALELGKESKAVLEGPWPVRWEIERVRNERGNGMLMERLHKEVRSMISSSRISRLPTLCYARTLTKSCMMTSGKRYV